MFKFFYGEELVDPATTQGSLHPFQQGEMEGIVKLSISQTNNMFLLYINRSDTVNWIQNSRRVLRVIWSFKILPNLKPCQLGVYKTGLQKTLFHQTLSIYTENKNKKNYFLGPLKNYFAISILHCPSMDPASLSLIFLDFWIHITGKKLLSWAQPERKVQKGKNLGGMT